MRLYFIFSSDTTLPRQPLWSFIQYVSPYNLYMAKVKSWEFVKTSAGNEYEIYMNLNLTCNYISGHLY